MDIIEIIRPTNNRNLLQAMKTNLLSRLLVLLFCASSLAAQTAEIPTQGEVTKNKNGKTCILSKNFNVDGFQLPAGSKLFLDTKGKLGGFLLSKDASVAGQVLPAQTRVFLNDGWGNKISFWLPRPTRIQGHLLPSCNDGIGCSLHPNGKLKAIWLTKDEVIDGIPCSTSSNIFKYGWRVLSRGTQRMVWFHDNGLLQQAMISHDIVVQDHVFKKGDLIYINRNGLVDLNSEKLK